MTPVPVPDPASGGATPDYGRAFALWSAGAGPDWEVYTHHPFVAGLGAGTLPRAAYLHYLAQDYVFLTHFARAWALAVVKAETIDEMRTAATTVTALTQDEMALHIATCAAEGIGEADLLATPEAPANLAYTRYVLEAGYTGDFLDLMAALAPCVLGYGEIGARLGKTARETPYRNWIDTYAGAPYQALCREVGGLIDAALIHRLGPDYTRTPRWPRLEARFSTATRLEIGFWEMGMSPG